MNSQKLPILPKEVYSKFLNPLEQLVYEALLEIEKKQRGENNGRSNGNESGST